MLLERMQQRGATFLSAQSAAEGNRELRGSAFSVQQSRYDLLEAYVSNTIYRRSDAALDAIANWQGLPTELRPLTVTPKVTVEWWPGHVYRHGRIPFADTVDKPIIDAWQMAMTWGGWANADLLSYVRYGANLGDVFAEVEVNDERQIVHPRLHHPRYLKDLELNSTRDVIMYRLDIPDWDDQRESTYRWGKKVTRETITTYYNGEPYGYNDMPPTVDNPFGFVPGVWVNHMTAGDGYHGAGCLEGLLPLFDELNGLRASVNDNIHRFARQPFAIATDDPKGLMRVLNRSQEGQPGDEQAAAQSALGRRNAINRARESVNVIPLPTGSQVMPLIQNLGLGEAVPHLRELKEEIEQALPEITLTKELRGMNYVSDPGARTLVEDGEHRLNAAAANYDRGIVRLAQMTLAIGGEMQRTGRWTERTQQQKLFTPFDLTSFQRGDLEIEIEPRRLTEPTMLDRAAEAAAVEALETQWGREHAGLTPDEIASLAQGRSDGQDGLDALLGRALGGAPAFREAV